MNIGILLAILAMFLAVIIFFLQKAQGDRNSNLVTLRLERIEKRIENKGQVYPEGVQSISDKDKRRSINKALIKYEAQEYDSAIKILVKHLDGFETSDLEKCSILNLLGIAQRSKGDYKNAVTSFIEFRTISERIKATSPLIVALENLGVTYSMMGAFPSALDVLSQAADIVHFNKDIQGEARILSYFGKIYFRLGQYDKSLAYIKEALGIFVKAKDFGWQAIVILDRSHVEAELGEFASALASAKEALRSFEIDSNKEGIGAAKGMLGTVNFLEGNYQKALEFYLEAYKMSKEIKDISGQAGSLGNISNVYIAKLDNQKSLKLLLKALRLYEKTGDLFGLANINHNIGVTFLRLGNLMKAEEHLDTALAMDRRSESLIGEGKDLCSIGALLTRKKDFNGAKCNFINALDIFDRIGAGAEADKAETLRQLGYLYAQQDNYEKATEYFIEALEKFRSARSIDGEAQALLALGIISLPKGRYQDAIEYSNQAKSLFISLGIDELVKEADGIIVSSEILLRQKQSELQ